jgi:hypothetical protein
MLNLSIFIYAPKGGGSTLILVNNSKLSTFAKRSAILLF